MIIGDLNGTITHKFESKLEMYYLMDEDISPIEAFLSPDRAKRSSRLKLLSPDKVRE